MKKFRQIRLVALDLDGVLINDTYSPVIKNFIEKHNGIYSREAERLIWGSPHIAGGHNMSMFCKLPMSAQKTIEKFFEEREEYIKKHPVRLEPGVKDLLKLLTEKGARITSYGGRTKEYAFKYLSDVADYFDKDIPYVDTNSIRPGVKEITQEIFGLNFNQILFIDDINRMAEVCKFFSTGFIGTPVTQYQLEDMKNTGVKYIATQGIKDIDSNMLDQIDNDLYSNSVWV
ncbi:hypothetical protein B6D12_12730 [Gilliamella apicola]|uniref:HAD family hydrolase n=1 Tax=Gilliamella apicola TaxID=1196095 RepID=UPI000A32EB54|nr:HAD family hydrolase [Gilliamella apicola]OTP87372.1 hypothetical protein B5S41_12315 [Gilliamella apicola]OTP92357.1 hypothetical protein B6D13_12850 [Gilliamella apicola]OTP98755.1 hypothetical protein B6D07_12780 [Gilliamella apicola]OTQ03869.1 hypothetical protein B6D12_12730 [Gilliamella apicola]OTQ26261.1 hypothetical protein B6D02_11930 [Gilliamella apicola]